MQGRAAALTARTRQVFRHQIIPGLSRRSLVANKKFVVVLALFEGMLTGALVRLGSPYE